MDYFGWTGGISAIILAISDNDARMDELEKENKELEEEIRKLKDRELECLQRKIKTDGTQK